MDLILLAVVLAGLTGLVYVLATLMTRETSYEEAVAEQRAKFEQEAQQALKKNEGEKKGRGKVTHVILYSGFVCIEIQF